MTSVLVAVGVHLMGILSWVVYVSLDPLPRKSAAADPVGSDEMTMILETLVVVPEPELEPEKEPASAEKEQQAANEEKDEPQPKGKPPESVAEKEPDAADRSISKQKRRFANTSPDQAGTPDADTSIIGDRDTRAASELAPTAGAPEDLPSQDGRNPIHPNHVETVAESYQDGSVGMDDKGGETEIPQYGSAGVRAAVDSPVEESVEKPVETTEKKVDVADLLAPDDVGALAPDYLKQGEMIAMLRKEIQAEQDALRAAAKEEAERQARLASNAIFADRLREAEQDGEGDGLGSELDQELKRGGFSGFKAKTKVTGSISRRGKSALNVRNSPLGRYQALVSKAVELQWRRNCDLHRDHIVPGVISLRFYVDKSGGVSGIKFEDVVGANYIERGFTQRAIRQAQLPKMPSDVLRELKGEPLELIYNFSF